MLECMSALCVSESQVRSCSVDKEKWRPSESEVKFRAETIRIAQTGRYFQTSSFVGMQARQPPFVDPLGPVCCCCTAVQ